MDDYTNDFLMQIYNAESHNFEEYQKMHTLLIGFLNGLGLLDSKNLQNSQQFSGDNMINSSLPIWHEVFNDGTITKSVSSGEPGIYRVRKNTGDGFVVTWREPIPPSEKLICENYSGKLREVTSLVPQKIDVMSNVSNAQSQGGEQMKYLTKRSDGRWQAAKIIDGKRRFVYGKTQAEAQDKLRALVGRKKREPARESFYNFSLWWLENCKKGSIAASTMKTYKTLINTHLKIKTPINLVTLQQLQELLSKLPGTRIKEEVYKMIRPIVRKAYELDYIKKDYAQFLEKGKIQRSEKRALTVDEQRLLFDALQKNMDVFARRTIFYLCTGARPSEIASVKKSELRDEYVKLNGTKTDGAVRWVKISSKMRDLIAGESKEFFIFNNKRFREHLQEFSKKIGIKYDIDVYTLRHTFSTNLYILRVPEKDRQVYLGHKPGSRITNEVYTTYSPDIKSEDIYNIYGDFLPKF
ncbi:MAG: tyrosine-type recombinase/integrase [Clostridia bacterium]